MLPGWLREPKLSGLNTLGELLWEGGLNFRVFGWPRVDTCVMGILERWRGGVTIPQLVKLLRSEAARGGSRFDLGGVTNPEKEECELASSCWLDPRSRVPGGLRGFSGLRGGLLPSPSSSLLLPSISCSSPNSPPVLRVPSLHLNSSLTLLPARSPPDLPVTCSSASWGSDSQTC